MLLCRNKYLYRFMQRIIIILVFVGAFVLTSTAQDNNSNEVKRPTLNPLLKSAFKKSVKPNPIRSEYVKPGKHELMYWPNYPLTAAQIEARNKEWERRNNKTIGGQILSDITSDIIKTQVNSLIYGKKPVAVVPKF
jgi:hypothetical protein